MSDLLIKAYKSNKGLYLASNHRYGSLYHSNKTFNGKTLEKSFKDSWMFLEGEEELTSIKELVRGTTKVVGYTLKDPSLENGEVIPLNLTLEELTVTWDDDYEEKIYKGTFKGVGTLYKSVEEKSEDSYIDLAFEVDYLGTINFSEEEEEAFKYTLVTSKKNSYSSKVLNLVNYRELDTILVDELQLLKRPCSISSETTYKIIRTYIHDHIDRSRAKIESDYDFCFSVDKLVSVKPYIDKREIKKVNGRSYAKPRFNSRTISNKTYKIFEMTHKGDNYRGYTPIEGFSGDSVEDLVFKMKSYLQDLMEGINAPLSDCECCNGAGYIREEETFKMNERV